MALDLGELFVKIAAHTQGFDTAENALKKMTKEQIAFEKLRVKQAQQTNKILTKEMSKVSKSARDSAMVFREYHKQAEMSNKANRALSGTLEQVELGFVSAGTRAHGASRRLSAATSRSRGFGLGLQNASYQMQDIIVQWEMGVDKARIFGQQLPQLLGGFGAMGALVGVGAAAIAMLVGNMMESEKEADKLDNIIVRLSQTIFYFGDDIKKTTEKIKENEDMLKELAKFADKASEAFAKFRGKSREFELTVLKDNVDKAKKEYEEASEKFAEESGSFFFIGGGGEDVQKTKQKLQEAQAIYERAKIEQAAANEYTIKANIKESKGVESLLQKYQKGIITLREFGVQKEILTKINEMGIQEDKEQKKLLEDYLRLLDKLDTDNLETLRSSVFELGRQMGAINKAGNDDPIGRFFNTDAYQKAIKFNAEVSKLTKDINELEPSQVGVLSDTLQKVAKSQGLGRIFDGLDTSKPEDLATAFARFRQEVELAPDSLSKLKDAMMSILSQTENLFGQISSQYAALASYHAQMAQQALDYGRTQSDVYMRIADSIYYSNNALAQSYQERAYAAAEAAAAEYQAQKEAQAKANAIAKDNFENQKKLQIVQAIMSTANAVMKAYAELGPYGAPIAAAMAALGAAQVGIISQQQYTPREKGGPFVGGQGLLVGERGPELLIPNRGGTVVNNKDLMNGLSGSGSTSINFTIQAIDTSDAMKIIYENRSAIVNIIQQEKNRTMGAQ